MSLNAVGRFQVALLQHANEFTAAERFGDIVIHARRQTPLAGAFEDIRGQGDNGKVGGSALGEFPGGLQVGGGMAPSRKIAS